MVDLCLQVVLLLGTLSSFLGYPVAEKLECALVIQFAPNLTHQGAFCYNKKVFHLA